MTPEEIATEFYIEFQTVCQRERDDTLPGDVAKWVLKYVAQARAEGQAEIERLRAALEAALAAVELVRSQFSGGSDLTIDQMVSALNGALAQARAALKEE